MSRRLLMISYFFPPLGGIASLRSLRFAGHLPEFGWQPTVVAPRKGDYRRDPSLAFPEERVVRTRSLEVSRTVRRTLGASGRAEVSPRSEPGRLRALARRWLYLPDAQVGWYPFALGAARALIRERRIDAVFSSAYPITAHLVARRLHRETGLPWIADFRDLWTDWSEEAGLRRRLDQEMERSILQEANAVVTVSPTYAEVLRSRGARGAHVITNAFDPEDFGHEGGALEPTVAYLGTYYPETQDIGAALRALGEITRRGEAGLRLRFIGEYPQALRPVIEESGLTAVVDYTGLVPHAEAVRHLVRSRLLLLGGPVPCDTPALRGNIAAKVFEYLGARRPILMVGYPDCDVARILSPFARARVVPPERVEDAREATLHLLRDDDLGEEPSLEPFTSRSLAGRLGRILDEACS